MDLKTLLVSTRQKFKEAGIETADLDARFLIKDLLYLTDTDLISGRKELSLTDTAKIERAVARRLQGEPVSRIIGQREFWGRKFFLSPATLDPRPDTEILIECVLKHPWNNPRILDLGTGTGCILITLLQEIPGSTGLGIDLSEEACLIARKNLHAHDLEAKGIIHQGDWLHGLRGSFDMIVSNPPYIPSAVIPTLDAGVKNHDPILALDGGSDGLAPYRFLLSNLKKFLVPGGIVFFEIGEGQRAPIKKIAESNGASLSRVTCDYGGIERVLEITYGDK